MSDNNLVGDDNDAVAPPAPTSNGSSSESSDISIEKLNPEETEVGDDKPEEETEEVEDKPEEEIKVEEAVIEVVPEETKEPTEIKPELLDTSDNKDKEDSPKEEDT